MGREIGKQLDLCDLKGNLFLPPRPSRFCLISNGYLRLWQLEELERVMRSLQIVEGCHRNDNSSILRCSRAKWEKDFGLSTRMRVIQQSSELP